MLQFKDQAIDGAWNSCLKILFTGLENKHMKIAAGFSYMYLHSHAEISHAQLGFRAQTRIPLSGQQFHSNMWNWDLSSFALVKVGHDDKQFWEPLHSGLIAAGFSPGDGTIFSDFRRRQEYENMQTLGT